MEFNGKKAKLVFTIKAVESIPCDVRGEVLAFGEDGEIVSDPIKTPWPMPWITEEISGLVRGEKDMPSEDKFKVYNPEESDQYVFVEVQHF